MEEKNKINLNKADGKSTDPKNDAAKKINPSQPENELEMIDEIKDAEELVNVPSPEEPASVQMPDVSEESISEAIENGPEKPKKKGFAWLWALIGIAAVLCVLGMVFMNRGNKEDETAVPAVEEVSETVADSSALTDTMALPAEENSSNEVSENPAPAETQAQTTETVHPAAAPASAPATSNVSGELETEALNVIKGNYGDGNVRKNALGSRYTEIQNRVNQLKREGKF